MILLRHLHVRALKQLRDVDIWFPRRGSILIEGHNEAGKSTLFEAIYFALYGAAIVGESSRAVLEDLVPHDAAAAHVELTLVTAAAELEIQRTLTQGKGGAGSVHHAQVTVRRPGAPTEKIHGPRPVNQRILQELSGLDGDALRNSCFMEQKALDRLEALTRDQREAAVARLLGLDTLRRVASELHAVSVEGKQQLEQRKNELELAIHRRRAGEANDHERRCAERVAASEALVLVATRDRQEHTRETRHDRLAALAEREADLQQRIQRAELVQSLADTLTDLTPNLAEARTQTDAQDQPRATLAELARVELDVLPVLLGRVQEIERLEVELATCQRLHLQIAETTARLTARQTVEQAEVKLATARETLEQARAADARNRASETLERWAQLTEAAALVDVGGERMAQLDQQRDAQAATEAAARQTARRNLALAAGLVLLTAIAATIGLLAHPIWVLALLLAILAAICGWQVKTAQSRLMNAQAKLNAIERQVAEARAGQDIARRLAGSAHELRRLETELAAAGLSLPGSVEDARRTLRTLDGASPIDAAQAILRLEDATQHAARAQAAVDAAQAKLEHLHDDIPAATNSEGTRAASLPETVAALQANLDQRTEAITASAAALGLASDAATLAAGRGAAEAQIAQMRQRLAARTELEERIAVQRRDADQALATIRDRLTQVIRQANALGLPDVEPTVPPENVQQGEGAVAALQSVLRHELGRLDPMHAREALAATRQERQLLNTEDAGGAMAQESSAQLRSLLARHGISATGDESLAELCIHWPLLAEIVTAPREELDQELTQAQAEAHHRRETALEFARERHLEDAELTEGVCRAAVAEAERLLRRHELAERMAHEVQVRIVRRVLPETAVYMRALLPELTAGRYRDVQLLADETSGAGADLRIRVWDQIAGRYVAKNLFSGGTRDQCSLALRLAFALATLPKELGAMPGFIFLDEPLSSFDGERSRALIEVLTRGTIARQFAQVLLISHSQSFDRTGFRYQLRMNGGRITASNLPTGEEARGLWAVEPSVTEIPASS